MGIDLKKYHEKLRKIETLKTSGKVTQIVGLVVEVSGLRGSIGERCSIISRNEETVIVAEIVGFKEDKALLMPLGDLH